MTRSVIGRRSDAGKRRSLASVSESDAWSVAGLNASQAVCSTEGASRRSDTADVELGIAWQWLHGAEDDGCKPGVPLVVASSQHVFATDFSQQECCVGTEAIASARPQVAASMWGQKKRCSPVEQTHSGAWMPDHNAAGIMAQVITERIRRGKWNTSHRWFRASLSNYRSLPPSVSSAQPIPTEMSLNALDVECRSEVTAIFSRRQGMGCEKMSPITVVRTVTKRVAATGSSGR
jgi:hypothetical protein